MGTPAPIGGKSAEDYADDYTDPELRERLKEEIKAGDRGGKPGQWSARKSQLLTHEYEAQGGGYRHEGERTESQRHLSEWTKQDWHTADGGDRVRGSDGTSRYLPDAAWQLLSDEEKRATDRRKEGRTSSTSATPTRRRRPARPPNWSTSLRPRHAGGSGRCPATPSSTAPSGPSANWAGAARRCWRRSSAAATAPDPTAAACVDPVPATGQPRRSVPNRAQLSSMAACAAGEAAPMSKNPWIMPS